MEFLAKVIRALIFPFRFAYLLYYRWAEQRRRAAVLWELEVSNRDDHEPEDSSGHQPPTS